MRQATGITARIEETNKTGIILMTGAFFTTQHFPDIYRYTPCVFTQPGTTGITLMEIIGITDMVVICITLLAGILITECTCLIPFGVTPTD